MDVKEFVTQAKEDAKKVWEFTVVDLENNDVVLVTRSKVRALAKLREILDVRIDWDDYIEHYRKVWDIGTKCRIHSRKRTS